MGRGSTGDSAWTSASTGSHSRRGGDLGVPEMVSMRQGKFEGGTGRGCQAVHGESVDGASEFLIPP
jgi:hypothetical protein